MLRECGLAALGQGSSRLEVLLGFGIGSHLGLHGEDLAVTCSGYESLGKGMMRGSLRSFD